MKCQAAIKLAAKTSQTCWPKPSMVVVAALVVVVVVPLTMAKNAQNWPAQPQATQARRS